MALIVFTFWKSCFGKMYMRHSFEARKLAYIKARVAADIPRAGHRINRFYNAKRVERRTLFSKDCASCEMVFFFFFSNDEFYLSAPLLINLIITIAGEFISYTCFSFSGVAIRATTSPFLHKSRTPTNILNFNSASVDNKFRRIKLRQYKFISRMFYGGFG